MGRAITELQHSMITLLRSLTTLQGSSVTDLQMSLVDLLSTNNIRLASMNTLLNTSSTDLQESTNSILGINRASITALQASTNTLLSSSVTDLQISANTLIALNTASLGTLQGSANSLLGSTNTLLGSVRDQKYAPQRHWYSTAGTTSEFSEYHFGFTSHNIMLDVTSGSLGLVQYKFGGSTGDVDGEIYAGESHTFDNRKSSTISVGCASNADPTIRIWAWG
jgi:hypothetical protein